MKLEPYDQAAEKIEPDPALCIFESAAVDGLGNLCSSTNKCLQAKTCNAAYGKYKTSVPSYDVVYSISEFWGEGFFHFMCENFVRLFVGLDWLRLPGRGMSAKIHVRTENAFAKQALQAVGIQSSRLVTGTVRAKAMIVPEPVGCGSPSLRLVQLARMVIFSNVLSLDTLSFKKTAESITTITVIKRHGSRAVRNHGALITALKSHYTVKNQFKVIEFDSLSMLETVKLFSKTELMIGPHGAGLSNALYMQPGRGLLEFMVAGKDVNACYMYLAIKLGLRYHTWSDPRATQNGGMTVDLEKVMSIVSQMMQDEEF
jgi:hypothetical protein